MNGELSFCTVAWIEAGRRKVALRMADGSFRLAEIHDAYSPKLGDRLCGNFSDADPVTVTTIQPTTAVCLTVRLSAGSLGELRAGLLDSTGHTQRQTVTRSVGANPFV
ncbi:hypothetical protein PFX98_11150 [Paucibacter sediminis]|uniref:Uncharacterized protein n=1 Tax=Paucibacter sediminis TaxID=3019553 RepID=A0AA95SPU3_9BURK|nr:hypothetical protein [Paucibacter sp. S2-9]WIT14152.1 hypothetical protein PFX98_11150 [Paucibacter sp. S2-9]